jgi:hypothetical protein
MTRRRRARFRRWANAIDRELARGAGKVGSPAVDDYDIGFRTAHEFRTHCPVTPDDFLPGLRRASQHDRDLGGAFGRHPRRARDRWPWVSEDEQ